MSEYAVVIGYEDDNKEYQSLILDTITENSVDLKSTITTHPMVSGELVADHMFDNPISISFSGTFSLNGNKGLVSSQEGSKLKQVQELFESIKSNGYKCDILKVHINTKSNNNQELIFKKRTNMVLDSIRWVEHINSLNFTFGFTEVQVAKITEDPVVDKEDANLPDITQPETLSFTDTLLNWESVDKVVTTEARRSGLMTENFWNYLLGSTVAAGLTFVSGLIVLGTISRGALIVTGVAAALVFLGSMISKAVKQKKFKVKIFEKYDDDRKNQKEVERFNNFLGDIHKHLSLLNESIKVYEISSDSPQEAMISIDGQYFIFTFTRNNIDNKFSLVISDVENKVVDSEPNLNNALTDIGSCTEENKLFRVPITGTYVYLFKKEEEKNNLTNYYIMTSTIKMYEFTNILTDVIKNAIYKRQ